MGLLLLCAVATTCVVVGCILLAWISLKGSRPPKKSSKSKEPLSVAFIHPDLGMGGAEKLVVETALLVQRKGHKVVIYTSHHDKERCFEATKDGTLEVIVAGDWFPREIFGRFQLPCAILRFIVTTAKLLTDHKRKPFDVIFVDQISATIPMLRWSGAKVLFYCHFPDQLLTPRTNILKSLYRLPLDILEEVTTAFADCILVNSRFTANVFAQTFKRISQKPTVLYPCVDPAQYSFSDQVPKSPPRSPSKRRAAATAAQKQSTAATEPKKDTILLSLNRFERKKNIGLAIDALQKIVEKLKRSSGDYDSTDELDQQHPTDGVMLYIAGGYDTRVKENVDHLTELKNRAVEAGVSGRVRFMPSISDKRRNELLNECHCLLYTPSNEHFGIVPLEAALASKPVIACASGGPLETVVDGETGFLREPNADQWADAIWQLIEDRNRCAAMGIAGREHVKKNFSVQQFTSQLEAVLYELASS